MKRIYCSIIMLLIASTVITTGCKNYSTAIGSERQIYVFADSLLWLDIQPEIEECFNDYNYTPRAETSFFVSWKPLSELNKFKDRLNLLFIGTTQDKNAVDKYLMNVVPAEFVDNVNSDKNFYFFKDNLFLNDQISIFMLAKDKVAFKQHFAQLQKDILKRFKEKYYARLKQRMFEQGEQYDMEEMLASEYGYKIKVEHDYFLANQNPDDKYVWLRRIDPDRWISIWRVSADSTILNKNSLISIRNKMTASYYDGDVVVEEETDLGMSEFGSDEVYKLTGTWLNDSLIVGGPFRMYVVPNKQEHSFYMLDIAVMAPSKDKIPYLDQLEVMAHTFKFVDKRTTD